MKTILVVTAWSLLSVGLASAQQIDIALEIYRGDEQIIDAFQTKLLQGGDSAIQAAAKLPDLVRGRRLFLEQQLKFQANSGQRSKHASSKEMLTLHREENYEVVDGLEIEIDPVLSADGEFVDMNLASTWARKDGREVLMNRPTMSVVAPSAVPILLQRWTEEDDNYLMMLTAAAGTKIGKAMPSKWMVYLDVAVYQSATDAQGKRNGVGRMVFPNRTGQRVRVEHYRPLFYDTGAGIESCNVGLSIETDPALSADGQTVDLAAAVSHSENPGGTERAGDIRVPKVTFHDGTGQLTILKGQSAPLPLSKRSLVNTNPQADGWQATLGVMSYGE